MKNIVNIPEELPAERILLSEIITRDSGIVF